MVRASKPTGGHEWAKAIGASLQYNSDNYDDKMRQSNTESKRLSDKQKPNGFVEWQTLCRQLV